MAETKINAPGLVAEIRPTDAEHIFFDANHNSGGGKDCPTACWMEIRGVLYGVAAHFYKWADGTWNLGLEKDTEGMRLYHHLFMNRADLSRNDASDSAKRKARETMTALVRQWVAENPDALVDAGRRDAELKRDRLRAKVAELQEQIDAALSEMQELNAQLS